MIKESLNPATNGMWTGIVAVLTFMVLARECKGTPLFQHIMHIPIKIRFFMLK